jgi:hypothetical protein
MNHVDKSCVPVPHHSGRSHCYLRFTQARRIQVVPVTDIEIGILGGLFFLGSALRRSWVEAHARNFAPGWVQ